MTTELAKAQDLNVDELGRIAQMLALSGFFTSHLPVKVQIAQIGTKILAGREMGYGPFASVNGIHVIQGKPVVSANLMAAAVKAHPAYNFRVRRSDNEAVEIEFFKDGESLGIESFSMNDAKTAGLTGKDNWKKYPRNMLFARCISNGVRFHCPDVFNGNAVYVPDELEEDAEHDEVFEPDPDPAAYDDLDDYDGDDDLDAITVEAAAEDEAAHMGNGNPFDDDADAGQPTSREQEVLDKWDGNTFTDIQQWLVDEGMADSLGHAKRMYTAAKAEVGVDKIADKPTALKVKLALLRRAAMPEAA